jgi:hypothetical protein
LTPQYRSNSSGNCLSVASPDLITKGGTNDATDHGTTNAGPGSLDRHLHLLALLLHHRNNVWLPSDHHSCITNLSLGA